MYVLLGLVTVVGGFVVEDDVGGDDGGVAGVGDGGVGDECDDDGQFLTFLMAGTSQQAHRSWNVWFTWSGSDCWLY